ncbi:hypothetical protein LCGC14_2548290 [marine sediment metagenome]|uniref:Uncharacterized protein n=1 Tax=marine sediment metagenome TaxID=412755 RepID=A0A0F9D019_9ZZZZ
MEYLKNLEDFGTAFKEGENLEGFFSKLVSFLERKVFNRISKRVNFLLTRINDQKLEIIADGNTDKNENGNWRISESSGDLIIEKRVSGTWTEVRKFHG